jgi:hypothetical protein
VSKNRFGFHSVEIPDGQYFSFDEDGQEIATRAVKAHELIDGAIEFILRTGDEPTTGDGIGVVLQVTPEQFEELGFIAKAKIAGLMLEVFPDPYAESYDKDQSRLNFERGQRVALDQLAGELGIGSLYEASAPIEELAEMPDIEPEYPLFDEDDFFFDEPEPTTPAEYFGTTEEIYGLAMVLEYGFSTAHAGVDHFLAGACAYESSIRETIAKITAEREAAKAEPKFLFCPSCKKMVNKELPHSEGENLIFCASWCGWVKADSIAHVNTNGTFVPAIDTTGNMVHPEAR